MKVNPNIPGEIKPGMCFIGNVNGAKIEVVKVEKNAVIYKTDKTNGTFTYGLEAFKRCNLTLIEGGVKNETSGRAKK